MTAYNADNAYAATTGDETEADFIGRGRRFGAADGTIARRAA
ncbi:MAG: hypothetical protein AAGF90_07235 [Pseudomonadota bacterium]